MNDSEFLKAFEAGTLPHFPHQAHLRMAWLYLRQNTWEEAQARIREGIRHFAEVHGADRKYHETITLFWARLVWHCIDQAPEITDFEQFIMRFPLLMRGESIAQHYSLSLLRAEAARKAWVEPDLRPLP